MEYDNLVLFNPQFSLLSMKPGSVLFLFFELGITVKILFDNKIVDHLSNTTMITKN